MKTEKKISGMTLALAIGVTATLKAQNLYVGNSNPAGTIGEYTASGAAINASLISGLDDPNEIAISGNDVFVANYGTGTIGEYTTSGATVNASLISGLNGPVGMAISGNNLFVVNENSNSVGEYTTSGATVNPSLITGLNAPAGIAIAPEPSASALAVLGAAVLWLWRGRRGFRNIKQINQYENCKENPPWNCPDNDVWSDGRAQGAKHICFK